MDIGGWLRTLGLGQYESAFVQNAIDTDVLPELTEGDLEKLGIPLGDRKRLIRAIKVMAGSVPGAPTAREVAKDTPGNYTPDGWRRATPLDRDDLRSRGLDCAFGAA